MLQSVFKVSIKNKFLKGSICRPIQYAESFLRDSTGREVDFLISCDDKPWFCVEVKNNDSSVSKNLFYFKDKLSIPYNYQVVKKCRLERMHKGIRVMPRE